VYTIKYILVGVHYYLKYYMNNGRGRFPDAFVGTAAAAVASHWKPSAAPNTELSDAPARESVHNYSTAPVVVILACKACIGEVRQSRLLGHILPVVERFSWYSGWADLAPFIEEVVGREDRILIPGVGNDRAIVDMYDAGFTNMVAFDYAPEGVRASRALFGEDRLAPKGTAELVVADARALAFPDQSFDAVLEKGTLDAIYLSGGRDKELGAQHLQMAVDELARV
jgi:hypothetical protein